MRSARLVMSESPASTFLNRRHLRLLLLVTALVQGLMFISYPLGTGLHDDNESAQNFLISEVASGNLLIGNVRYNTGYAFVMAPLRLLTDTLDRLADRALLLLQTIAYSAVPFLVYDMLRRRFNARLALITALLVLVDPFGLQWVHFQLPGWLIALAAVAALWLAQLAWGRAPRQQIKLIALAAIGLGLMSVARLNFAPLVAIFGCGFLLWRHVALRQRITLFATVGLISGGILGGYIALIHLPSTGTTTLSCTTGATLVASLPEKGFELRASNGPHARRYAQLLTLPPARSITFFGGSYALWRNPGPWVSAAEREAFLAQPFGETEDAIDIVFPGALYWYLGPCAADALLTDVYREAIGRDPAKLLLAIGEGVVYALIQHPGQATFPLQYLDSPDQVNWQEEGPLGFAAADSARYNGHRLWRPGVQLYSALFPVLNLLKLLTPLALIAALWRRDWLLATIAGMLLLGLLLIATFASIEPRYYASLSPLYMMLIGCFLGQVYERIRDRR